MSIKEWEKLHKLQKDKENLMRRINGMIIGSKGTGFTLTLGEKEWTNELKQSLPKEFVCKTKFVISELAHKIVIIVPGEYAARIYKEKFTDVVTSFKDTLLTKHRETLSRIAQFAVRTPDIIIVSEEGLRRDFHEERLWFEDLGMLSLDSIGQVYGMALAIIEYANSPATIEFNDIYNESVRIKFSPPKKESKKLKEWN